MYDRSLSSLALCPRCLQALERQRVEEGDGVAIYCACEDGPDEGVFAVWKNEALILKPCHSLLQAQVWGASIAARSVVMAGQDGRGGLQPH
jgi:hypothetical protein